MYPTPPLSDVLVDQLNEHTSVTARVNAWLDRSRPFRDSNFRKRARSQSPEHLQYFPVESLLGRRQARYRNSLGNMSDPQQTSPPPSTPRSSNTKPPSIRSASTSLLDTDNPCYVRSKLKLHHLYQESRHLLENYPTIHEEITTMLGKSVIQDMSDASVTKFKSNLKVYKDRNEDSFLHAMLPLLLKETYVRIKQRTTTSTSQGQDGSIRAGAPPSVDDDPFVDNSGNPLKRKADVFGEAEPDSLREGQVYMPKDWFDEGIVVAVNEQFKQGCLPNSVDKDNELVHKMRKDQGMKQPKPDRIYCLQPELFSPPAGVTIPPFTEFCLTILTLLWHCFFLVEGKSAQGIIAEAKNQACRAGAAAVYRLRLFLDEIGEIDPGPGFDSRTYIFSMTIHPDGLTIWVHFAEMQKDGITVHYHMCKIFSAEFDDYERLGMARRYLDNIQDWGSGKRKEELKTYHTQYYSRLRTEMEAADAAAAVADSGTRGGKTPRGSPRKGQRGRGRGE